MTGPPPGESGRYLQEVLTAKEIGAGSRQPYMAVAVGVRDDMRVWGEVERWHDSTDRARALLPAVATGLRHASQRQDTKSNDSGRPCTIR